ncbi:NADP-dependent oxidoreductase [Umezawaea endophytica]|uniref:NADP-dependent oxidoreductase n=1 Tax=Umezawaea endophytica TaxID=1654476 RepID=A0A9X3A4E9_9PSEU|nr:NADP-dependent oxidoreductase [Umezawaea endophytica]MCS7482774.1 NADP-dependent oxidoreductase [Umezawaea endophytica]
MRALVSHSYGPVDQIEVAEVPTPFAGPGQVLVRVQAASLNPLDGKLVTGAMREMMPVEHPFTLGFDVTGTVEALGEGTSGLAVGDTVVAAANGTIAEYAVVDAASAVVHGLDAVRAAALPVAGLTAAQLVETADLKSGDRVLVVGATGGVGAYAVQLAAQLGAEVWATARPEESEFVLGLGARHAVDYTSGALAVEGLDVVIDLVNFGAGIPSAVLRDGGRVVSPLGGWDETTFDRGVTAEYAGNSGSAEVLRELVDAVEAGKLAVTVGGTAPFDESARAAKDFFTSHKRGKVVITF